MTNQEAKAEAEKIKEEFYKAIPLKGFKGTYSTFMDHATQCAIIYVKAQIDENHHMDNSYDLPVRVVDVLSRRLDYFQSILTELERR